MAILVIASAKGPLALAGTNMIGGRRNYDKGPGRSREGIFFQSAFVPGTPGYARGTHSIMYVFRLRLVVFTISSSFLNSVSLYNFPLEISIVGM